MWLVILSMRQKYYSKKLSKENKESHLEIYSSSQYFVIKALADDRKTVALRNYRKKLGKDPSKWNEGVGVNILSPEHPPLGIIKEEQLIAGIS